jgi:hypothetical protein
MFQPQPTAVLSRCRAELAAVHETIRTAPLDADGLRAAVQELAGLTQTMAELAGQLAAHTETGLPSLPAAATRDIAADLRTTAKQLTTATVLLEPAIADLADLSTDAEPPAAVRSGSDAG